MSQTRGATEALARASADLAAVDDVLGHLVRLLRSAEEVLGFDGSAVMVHDGSGLEVLCATRHDVAELEVHQAAAHSGPCTDAFEAVEVVDVAGERETRERWPDLAEHLAAAGYASAAALPLVYRGEPIGALGLFRHAPEPLGEGESLLVARAFADLSAVTVVRADRPDVADRIRAALTSRVAVERAKGVLAETERTDMAGAYALLLARAERDARPLAEVAEAVVAEVLGGRG